MSVYAQATVGTFGFVAIWMAGVALAEWLDRRAARK